MRQVGPRACDPVVPIGTGWLLVFRRPCGSSLHWLPLPQPPALAGISVHKERISPFIPQPPLLSTRSWGVAEPSPWGSFPYSGPPAVPDTPQRSRLGCAPHSHLPWAKDTLTRSGS